MTQIIRRLALSTLGIGVLSTGMLATAPVIAAKGGDATIRTGNCSMNSDWKLKVKPDDGKLEVEFEVDQNKNGQLWNVTLKRDGNAFFSGQKTTKAPSGSFSIERRTTNGAGTDKIVGKATNAKTGETCKGVINF
jgi:hypothetical protein